MYKKDTGNSLSFCARFADLSDFIAWYVHNTYKRLKISKTNYYWQYLAYHVGWGNYKDYKKKQNVVSYAKEVDNLAQQYRSQLKICRKGLHQNKYIFF